MYVYLMKNFLPINESLIQSHVEFLKELDRQNQLVLCGPFTDFPGGMVILSVEDKEEAVKIAESDPFVASGCKTYELRTFAVANQENNYLL
ncbi:YciI family protein [Candidatus Galacturonibacter soehngenii]|uniref:YCII-related domain-containing protein n=1 Tax=Candidatus Galacturonatibacter soehngenii TaxID=2307010 RepID=A0A7V7QJR3_9FIRM|nr:YciI family protein [Candidatus Galacturonibacter soehngenii]KAB1437932.1 hypothetical protein F7O84_10120 [Candidatus Galacturonibacter soehngenii]MBA4687713.1 hypothetical protein [Candidatus Galacturonibacter soehngenii]